MYNNVVGIIKMRKEENPLLYDVFCGVSEICDQILVIDPDLLLTNQELKMIHSCFEAEIVECDVKEVDYCSYSPEWVFACYNDERPSRRFEYMKVSLCMNPFINTWLCNLRYLWDDEAMYRIDKGWFRHEAAFLYRYIHEIDYKWSKGLIPKNQPGPMENSMMNMYSSRFIDERSRLDTYMSYRDNWEDYSFNDRILYESLADTEITVEQAVD